MFNVSTLLLDDALLKPLLYAWWKIVTVYDSGPDRAVGTMYVCVCLENNF